MSYDGIPRDTVDALNYAGSFHVNPAGYYTWFQFPKDSSDYGLRQYLKYDTLIYDSRQNIGLGCGNHARAYVVATKIR
jgi:hypothetical protein